VAAARVDSRAFAALYERYVGQVYRYCYVRTGSREAAEDATSEVFLRALGALGGYRDGMFVAWLFRIAHNVTVDVARRQRPTAPLAALGDPPDREPTPEAVALARERATELRAALARLSDEQRAAVELRLAGWSGEQIGATLGKSPDAVKMLRSRAIGRLRAILGPGGRDSGEAEHGRA
jgi:RNA polymerase sigma-70 factor, ECF subfamily